MRSAYLGILAVKDSLRTMTFVSEDFLGYTRDSSRTQSFLKLMTTLCMREGIIEKAVGLKGYPKGLIIYHTTHPVVRQDNITTKVRVVFDASCAEGDRLSLNQCLHIGPSFGQSILEILIRFNIYEVLIGDVEKAFLMIRVAEKD